MNLFYSPGACSLASHIVLHEGKFPASFTKVNLKTKQTESGKDFTAINPKGYVPTLELDNGEVLTENIAILQYLASQVPALLPQEGMAKWHGIESLAFVSTELHKSFKPLFKPDSTEEQKQAARDFISQRLGLLAAAMGDRDFVVGNAFTVVDAYLFVMLVWASKFAIDIPAKLVDFQGKMKERASVKEAMKMEGLLQPS